MKKKKLLIFSIIVILLLAMGGAVYAYFTDYTTANGYVLLSVNGYDVDIKSKLENGKYSIEVENIGDADAYVRIKVLTPDYVTVSSSSTNWTLKNDGYWYYTPVLEFGETSGTLELSMKVSGDESKEFNVVTNTEATMVWYNEDGSTYADWEYSYLSTNEE